MTARRHWDLVTGTELPESAVRQTIPWSEFLNRFGPDEIEEFLENEIGYKVVCDRQIDSRRWHSIHWYVVERLEDETFWGATYERGLTESQHLDRYECWGIHTYDRAKRGQLHAGVPENGHQDHLRVVW